MLRQLGALDRVSLNSGCLSKAQIPGCLPDQLPLLALVGEEQGEKGKWQICGEKLALTSSTKLSFGSLEIASLRSQ
jgi:hypothetical protein